MSQSENTHSCDQLGVIDTPTCICSQCGKSLATASGLRRHIARLHRNSAATGSVENELAAVTETFSYPLPDKWRCSVCKELFYNQQTLKRHQSRHHSGSKFSYVFSCTVCHAEFDTARKTANHFQSHKKASQPATHSRSETANPTQLDPQATPDITSTVITDTQPAQPSQPTVINSPERAVPSSTLPSPPVTPVLSPRLTPESSVQNPDPPVPVGEPHPTEAAALRPTEIPRDHDPTCPQAWIDALTQATVWDDFEKICEDFTQYAAQSGRQRPDRGQAKQGQGAPRNQHRPQPRPPQTTFDTKEASRLQKLYRTSKKRAIRHILKDDTPSFSGTEEHLLSFFREVYTSREIDEETVSRTAKSLFDNIDHGQRTAPSLVAPMELTEISTRLSRMANSAPGKDRLEYRHIRKADGACRVTQTIYNRCLQDHRIPATWKEATTILLHKSGPTEDPANFRPIALQSCLYKLFMAVMSDRLTKWAIDNNFLSPEQKSARPCEGCYEHTFLLSAVLKDCKRNQKTLSIAWLDLRNAFGSIPHNAIHTILATLGVPEHLILLLKDAYTGATTSFITPNGPTDHVPIEAGVKQGCPMSAVLFNLTIELIIRAVKKAATENHLGTTIHGKEVSILAYADDLVLLSRTPAGLQTILDTAGDAASTLQLNFKPQKCATLTLHCKHGTEVKREEHTVQESKIPSLSEEQKYRYLGVPIGLERTTSLTDLVNKLASKVEAISSSLLAPWQKIDAIKTFVQPGLHYALRATEYLKSDLRKLRTCITKHVKKICQLPIRATNSFIFAAKQAGGLAFTDPNIDADILVLTQATRILSSDDETVRHVATEQLKSVVHRTIHSAPNEDDIDKYLSGSNDGPLANSGNSGQASSLWSRTRAAARRMKVEVQGATSGTIILVSGEKQMSPRSITTTLRQLHKSASAEKLKSLPDQGKVARALSQDAFANGSSWHSTGGFIRFCDWKFIHRARLNCLPTNATARRWKPDSNTKCRRCTHPQETLPHILNHCVTNMVPIRRRHNLIQERLVKSIRHGDVFIDQHVPGDPTPRERPDVTVIEGNKITIIDITVPFDNGNEALSIAAKTKREKYSALRQSLSDAGKDVQLHAFVVGSLGTWHQDNERVLGRLGVSRRYRTLMRRLCCIDAIRASRDIYIEHMSGHRQYAD